MTEELVSKAIESVTAGRASYCKFLSANDSGETGGHQSGILISMSARDMLFTPEEMRNNHILKKTGKILWQSDYTTNCTFTWYTSKNELRITGFGRGLSPLSPELTGALFVLVKLDEENYDGYLFNTDDSIRDFLDSFGMTPAETNRLIETNQILPEVRQTQAIKAFIATLDVEFPVSSQMSAAARMLENNIFSNHYLISSDPDQILLRWTDEEFRLFKALEEARYGELVSRGFSTVDDFVLMANQVLNRRKSRAGKSLEHHLSAIFDENNIQYTAQAITEGNKKPDFLFPSEEAYHDMTFSVEKLCTLAAKTTCKDRWRQILSEANRLRDKNKYLCTFQQGISSQQLDEMQGEKVILVVPKEYHTYYPRDKRDRLWTVKHFVDYVMEMEGLI